MSIKLVYSFSALLRGLDHKSAHPVQPRGIRPLAEHGLAREHPHRSGGLGRIYDQGLVTDLLPSASWACGCTFDPPGRAVAYPNNLFESEWGGTSEFATMRWKGKVYNLKLVSKKEPKKSKPGATSVRLYAGISTPIQVTVTGTRGKRICAGPEVCEAADYKAKITVSTYGRTDTVSASGACVC